MRFLSTTLRRRLVSLSPQLPALTSLVGLLCPRKYEAERAWRRRSASILGPDLPEVWKHLASSSPAIHSPSSNHDHNGSNPTIIDGKIIAEDIRLEIASEIRHMKDLTGKVPGLAMLLVGKRRDSESYVRHKVKACEEVGITSLSVELPEDCTQDDLLNIVSSINKDPSIHGILVQLPLPKHMDEEKVLSAISLEKDVDGFHPLNVGNLAIRGREPLFVPCAAKACIELLLRSGVELMGKHVAVIGRSRVVGLPTSLLLQANGGDRMLPSVIGKQQYVVVFVLQIAATAILRLHPNSGRGTRHHATVSIIHAHSENPESITREADVVISAAGVPNLVRRNWLKRGSVVIDVGTTPVEDPESEHGYHLAGDVCYEEALQVVSAITPVPGGVGPVTISMLLSNTLDAAKRACGFS